MKLGKKLEDTILIIKWCYSIGIDNILIPFDAELEVQLWRCGFNCQTLKYRDGKYVTKVT